MDFQLYLGQCFLLYAIHLCAHYVVYTTSIQWVGYTIINYLTIIQRVGLEHALNTISTSFINTYQYSDQITRVRYVSMARRVVSPLSDFS